MGSSPVLDHIANGDPVPGSFRDPSGHVYEVDDRIVRTVTDRHAAHFDFVSSTGLFDHLAKARQLLPIENLTTTLPSLYAARGIRYVLEVPRLPFVSFPYEWSFSALKAAALLQLDVHLTALERGATLSDASAYNVQFQGARPVFIDHLSFRRYRPGEFWGAHRQFCEQFLVPLLLRSLFGITHNAWYRGTLEGIPVGEFSRMLRWRHYFIGPLLTHVVMQSWLQGSATKHASGLEQVRQAGPSLSPEALRRLLDRLRRWIARLEPLDTGKTVWQNYVNKNTYDPQDAAMKQQVIRDFVSQHRPAQLWDFGCNVGEYAKIALQYGARYVVGIDCDQGAIEACYARAHEEDLPLQSLFVDLTNPSPSQGWKETERPGLQARSSPDALMALAFMHHLVISRNIPFGQLIDWLIELAPRGILEFVPKSDPMVQQLLSLREDIFPDYTFEFFKSRLAQRAQIQKTVQLSTNGRLLVWYERR